MRELDGGSHTAFEFIGESQAAVLSDAALFIARTEVRHPRTGAVYNERGVARIHTNEDEQGYQIIVFFEGV
jgi:hypothetical protein